MSAINDSGPVLANVTAPDPAAPNFAGAYPSAPNFNPGSVQPPPDVSNLPRPNPAGDPQIEANLQRSADNANFHRQTAEQEQAAADVMHHAVFGKAVKSLVGSLNGTQTSYRANPETGQVEEVQTPQRPGAFFRNLISGMLVGAAAGGERPTDKDGRPGWGGGFAGGLSRGIGAGLQARSQQDQQQYTRAQQQLKNQQEQQRITDEDTLHKAQVAHLNIQIAGLQQNLHNANQEIIDNRNASTRAYEQSLKNLGAMPAKLIINGKTIDTISASDLARAYTKDPTIAQASTPNAERHFLDITDLSELHWNGTQWLSDAGDPVNMSDKTQIRMYDVPTNSLKAYRQVPNSEINKIAGSEIVPKDGTSNINGDGLLALRTLGLKNDATAARAAAQKARADQNNKNAKTFTTIESKKAVALAKAEHDYWTAVNKSPDPQHPDPSFADQLNAAKQNAQDAYEAEIRAAGGTAGHFAYNQQQTNTNPQIKVGPPQIKVGQTVTLKGGHQVQVTKVNPNGTFEYR